MREGVEIKIATVHYRVLGVDGRSDYCIGVQSIAVKYFFVIV